MLVLEAIFAFLRRSLGSVLRAMFGWATLALFGEVREKERPLLTIVVAAAAFWPFLLIGTIFPRPAALVLAVLPVPRGAPESILRGIWIALTLLIPLGVGWALTRRNPDPAQRRTRRLLLGFPTTLGLGLGFLFVCVAVPVRKIAALATGKKEEHVPMAIPPEDYTETVRLLREALTKGGIAAEARRAPWGTRALGRLLHVFAGTVLRAYQPSHLEYVRGDAIAMTFYPNGVRLYGTEAVTARAHSLLAEAAPTTPALLSMSPEGQKLERRIRELWSRRSEAQGRLDADVQATARALAEAPLGFRDWETLYRELLQVVVAYRGASKLMQAALARKNGSRAPSARRGLRRAGRTLRTHGSARLGEAAADGSLKVIETVAERVLRVLAGPRR